MKKFFLLLFVLSFLSANLYSQREIVLETFDNWGGNGLPVGYEWRVDSTAQLYLGCVSQVGGNIGSAVKITNLYATTNAPNNDIRKTIDFVDVIPNYISVTLKNSGPQPRGYHLWVTFMEEDSVGSGMRFYVWLPGVSCPEWYTYTKFFYNGPREIFNFTGRIS